jgi:CubicO group peptidase (beta-lactamase class C family)
MKSVTNLMEQAVSNEVFPGGVLLVSAAGSEIFFQAYGYANIFSGRLMTRDTVFDLASFTKPLATTLAIIKLISQQKLELGQHLGSILTQFNSTDKGRITIENLLYHNSGYPDYRPYYKVLNNLEPNLRKDVLRQLLVKETLINSPGNQVIYSDIGFMILCWVIEHVSGNRLDRFVTKEIYDPLGLENLFFVDLDSMPREVKFAATERCSWRNILLEGAVHDDNAYVLGGIQGHAGLFGTAQDVLSLLSELMSAYLGSPCAGVFDRDLIQMFFKRQELTGRALGFDTPSPIDPSCGQYFSKNTVGHLGFTGTSFWMDLDRNVMIILLTNRVHPSRSNNKIKAFRPKLHDRIMTELINNGLIKKDVF